MKLEINEQELDLLIESIEGFQADYEAEIINEGKWDTLWDLRVKLLGLYKK